MDVILHLGAHRTGTTTFQDYLRRHADGLSDLDLGLCLPSPPRVLSADGGSGRRDGDRVLRPDSERIRTALASAKDRGMKSLLVSNADMMGSIAETVSARALYPDAARNVAQRIAACDGRIAGIVLSVRSLEVFWASALAELAIHRGSLPDRETLHDIATSPRSWRDVIADIAATLPGAPLLVLPFDRFAGQPDVFLETAVGCAAPFDEARTHLRRAPSLPDLRREVSRRGACVSDLPFGMGRWTPFRNEEYAALREKHADDMMWLTSGADGLATLISDRRKPRAEGNPPFRAQEKGQRDEFKERHLAGHRRG